MASERLEVIGNELDCWESSALTRSRELFPELSRNGILDTDPLSAGDLVGLAGPRFWKNLDEANMAKSNSAVT